MIADVRDYTQFTHERGDSEAARLARRFAELARDAVAARDGRVIELRGDEALAVFESPRQAVLASVELQATCVEETSSEPDLPLRIGIGIDAGEAVAVEEGYRGTALNMAARLCSRAEAGQVLTTSRVAEQAGDVDGLHFIPNGTATLKGFDDPVAVLEVTGELGAAPAKEPPRAALPPELDVQLPVVGRSEELSWLRGTWRQVRRGHGRIAFLSGPAGVGKTRLAAELAAWAASQGAEVRYSGAGGAAAAEASSNLQKAAAASRPMLVVVDDLEAGGQAVVQALEDAREPLEQRPALVIGLVRDPNVTPEAAALVEEVDRFGDGHRRLGALDLDGVRAIARVYVGVEAEDVPIESMLRASEGVPGRIHELVAEWAREEASRRLEAAAEWLAKGRERRSADLEFANNVIGLRLRRLYAVDEGERVERARICPYKGLASFGEADAASFFGRESLVGELAARTVGTGLLAIVGASGSGKSSVIAAGLLPSLRAGLLPGSGQWRHALIRPGERPVTELAGVERSGEGFVLVVDQFEEVFTLCRDEEERVAFVDALVEIAGDESSIVVLSLRGDFIDRCAEYPKLAELISGNQVLVGPMSQDELRRAIELPARRCGLRVEAALADALVDEVADEPGALPLLSTALVELWRNHSDGWLRMEAYERTDGVRGAVARLAEGTYEQLGESERHVVRSVFLRLSAPGEGEAVARQRVAVDEFDLDRDPVAASVLSRLTEDRLLTRSNGTVEVAHEALFREWPRMQEWLREDAQGRELRHHLAQAVRQWEARGRDKGDLYRGARLSATLDWAAGRDRELNQLERDFLASSRQASERAVRRLRAGIAILGLLLLVAVGAGIYAFHQSAVSKHEARIATGRALTAASAANLAVDPERSILLALKAIDTFRSTSGTVPREAVEALHRAIETSRVRVTVHTPASKYVAFSPDGRLVAIGGAATASGQGGEAVLWNSRTGRKVLVFPRQKGGVGPDLRFSPDGSRLYTHVAGRGIEGWSTKTGKQLVLLHDPGPINNLALSPDETRLATTSADGKLKIWSLRRRRLLLTINAPSGLCGTSFSPDGTTIAAGLCFGGGGGAWIWDTRTGRKLAAVGGARFGWAFNVAFSPDGRKIVTVGNEGKGRVWDARSSRLLTTLEGHTGWIWAAKFGPNGARIATVSSDGTARTWDAQSGLPLLVLAGHTKNVFDVAFSPDGGRLLTGSADGTARIWDVRPQGGRDVLTLPAQQGLQGALVTDYSPDGKLLVAGGSGPVPASLWDASTGKKLRNLPHTGDVYAAAFSPDGKRILLSGYGTPVVVATDTGRVLLALRDPGADWQAAAAWSPNGRLIALGLGDGPGGARVFDAHTGKLLRSFPYPVGVSAVAFSPDGTRIAVSSFGTTARIWRLGLRGAPTTLSGHTDSVTDIAFSPDGRRVVTSSLDGTARVWDTASGRPLETVQGQSGALWDVSFSPDGKNLATAGDDTTARLWDATSGTELLTLTGPSFAIRSVSFSPDGTRLATASGDGNVRVYVLPLGQLMAVARSRLTRTWTTAECRQFLNTKRCPTTP